MAGVWQRDGQGQDLSPTDYKLHFPSGSVYSLEGELTGNTEVNQAKPTVNWNEN